ncbi:MAG: N-6 DNA methylase [Blastocatellales bacterium]
MTHDIEAKELERLALQASLDAGKPQAERNRMGQYATPTALAEDILHYAVSLLTSAKKVSFLDPAIGTGSFYSALLKVIPKNRVAEALGFELDPQYGKVASDLWKDTGLLVKIADFTYAEPSPRFNMVICNPPYVRHHHLDISEKTRLQICTNQASGMKLGGLAGLYCHFLGISHAWMAEGGIAGWLIPSEFMDVNYGHAVKRYLLNNVTLLHIHRFDPTEVQFTDALVSSAVVWFKNTKPSGEHKVKFTFGGSLFKSRLSRLVLARDLANEPKWTRFPAAKMRNIEGGPTLSDFFHIKRGIATGDNGYFILSEEAIATKGLPREVFTSILPSPRYLQQNEVRARKDGTPDIDRRLFLLNTKLSEQEIRRNFPSLYEYLKEGKLRGLHERYLCKHRSPWYSQENRPAAPIVCTYLGRGNAKTGKPFRFILNGSRATVPNVYLALYPTPYMAREISRDPSLLNKVWSALNNLSPGTLIGEGRVYGGGLYKLEPRELGNLPAKFIEELLPRDSLPRISIQPELFTDGLKVR